MYLEKEFRISNLKFDSGCSTTSYQRNIIFQDNQSAILLETNGRRSAGKRLRALNVRYFFVADNVEKGIVEVMYCPTEKMTGDFMTKPLQGSKYTAFDREIMGLMDDRAIVDDQHRENGREVRSSYP